MLDWVVDWVVDWVGVVRYPRGRRGVGFVLLEGYLELGVGSDSVREYRLRGSKYKTLGVLFRYLGSFRVGVLQKA